MRRALESAAAELAAVWMSDAEADALMRHLDALGDDPDIDTLVANDLEFHHMIAVGSGNPVLCSLMNCPGGHSGPGSGAA